MVVMTVNQTSRCIINFNIGSMKSVCYILLGIASFAFTTWAAIRPTAIRIDNNGYSGVLVAIHPSVPQDEALIDNIKDMFSEASSFLYSATAKRAFFKEITILVPNTWDSNPAWAPATSQLFNNGDVIIQVPPKIRKDSRNKFVEPIKRYSTSSPYTRSYGGCGQPGVRIHIFTDMFSVRAKFIIGSPGHVLVHQWAHFRWGVFDEFSQEGEPQFYFSPTTGRLEAVRCNINMKGRIYRKDPVTGKGTICVNVNAKTGVYEEGCLFSPYTRGHFNDNITSSIMDRPVVPTITKFCNDDQSDWKRVHNYESPSRHNRLCGSRSTWAIISQSQDFQGGKNPPRQLSDITPRFTVVQSSKGRTVVLAVDTSSSMQRDGKLVKANQAVATLLEEGLDDQTLTGIVSFAAKAEIALPLEKMDSLDKKKNASRQLPKEGREGTNMSDGLLKSLEIIETAGRNQSEKMILLLTDGLNTVNDDLEYACERLIYSGVIINMVAFSNTPDPTLVKAVHQSGGQVYFDINTEESTSAVDSVLDVMSLFNADIRTQPVNILSQAKTITSSDPMVGNFWIDHTLGRETKVIVTYTEVTPILVVRSPSGRTYRSIYPEYSQDKDAKRIKIDIPGIAETGIWKFSLTTERLQKSLQVAIMVISKSRSTEMDSLKFSGAFWLLNDTWPLRSQIAAEVFSDGHPVRGIKVKAIVERPFTHPVEFDLHDGGAGADAVRDDGVYTRFFNQFSTSGHYTVRLEAIFTSKGGQKVVMATGNPGSLYVDHPNLPTAREYLIRMREKAIQEEFPPGRITDLRVLHTSHSNSTIVLSWTAPGGDDDHSQASSYTVAMSETVMDMISEKGITLLDPTAVTKGDLKSPQLFGEREEIKIKLDFLPMTNISLVFAVWAIDEHGNSGEKSNFVTVGLGVVPDFSSEDYLEEKDKSITVSKFAPHNQRILISTVLGFFSGVLLLAVVITSLYYLFNRKRKKAEEASLGSMEKVV